MKFNIGDRVRFVGQSSFIKKGAEGVVTSFDMSGPPQYNVDLERWDGDDWNFDEYELELVE